MVPLQSLVYQQPNNNHLLLRINIIFRTTPCTCVKSINRIDGTKSHPHTVVQLTPIDIHVHYNEPYVNLCLPSLFTNCRITLKLLAQKFSFREKLDRSELSP